MICFRLSLCLLLHLLVLGLVPAFAWDTAADAPVQPIAFDHKLHAGSLKTACATCHVNPDPGEMMGLPAASDCMSCHSTIEAKTPGEKKLAAFARMNRDIEWARVYQLPGFVRFNHRQHVQAGAKCETCHGAVTERTALFKEKEVSMGVCMDCHRQTRASIDCGTCHTNR